MADRWMPHRQAYFPRAWPPLLFAAVFILALDAVIVFFIWDDMPWWVAGLMGGVVGLSSSQIRVAVWKWRHPELSDDELLASYRRTS